MRQKQLRPLQRLHQRVLRPLQRLQHLRPLQRLPELRPLQARWSGDLAWHDGTLEHLESRDYMQIADYVWILLHSHRQQLDGGPTGRSSCF